MEKEKIKRRIEQLRKKIEDLCALSSHFVKRAEREEGFGYIAGAEREMDAALHIDQEISRLYDRIHDLESLL